MCRFFETIRITDGIPQYLHLHENRMNRTRNEIWGVVPSISLERQLLVPLFFSKGTVRCKLVYDKEIKSVDFSFYQRKRIRSLMLVSCDTIDYHNKDLDRASLERLLEQKEQCDEIIIVKNGFITDSSMANLIFFDGKEWFTPAIPLLPGTCRERLLNSGLIHERKIKPADLDCYLGVKLINAMRYPEESELIPNFRISSSGEYSIHSVVPH